MPFLRQSHPATRSPLKAFPNDVRLVYKQFPLDTHAQGKFWPLHDKMYANSRAINRQTVLEWAKEFGLDMPKFTKVFDAPETHSAVDRDLADGGRADVNATPTLFINGKKYQGAVALAQLTPIRGATSGDTRDCRRCGYAHSVVVSFRRSASFPSRQRSHGEGHG